MAQKDEYHQRTIQSSYSRIDADPDPNIHELADELQKLREQVAFIMQKRITQVDVVPGSIKQRAMGEANLWVRGGATAKKPTTGESTANGYAMFYDTTAKKLYIWNSDANPPAWQYASFS